MSFIYLGIRRVGLDWLEKLYIALGCLCCIKLRSSRPGCVANGQIKLTH